VSDIQNITKKLLDFRDERDWKQFHNSKDLALAISIESSELLELFLWKNAEEVNVDNLKDELADVMAYCLLLAEKHKLSITEIVEAKILKNNLKYPAEKAKGKSTKYTDL